MTVHAQILIVAFGTLGDVGPFAVLGSKLRARGFVVTLFSNADHAPLAARFGLQFAALAPPHPPQDEISDARLFHEVAMQSFAASYAAILEKAKRGTPLAVVAHDLALGGLAAAEKLQLPCVRIILAPCGLAQTRDQSEPSPHGDPGAKLAFDNFRRERNLRPLHDAGFECLPAMLEIGLFSAHFAPPNVPTTDVLVAGFPPAANEGQSLDAALADFLQSGTAPVVFTPGTGVTATATYFQVVHELCSSLSLRAIVLGRSATGEGSLSRDILVRKFVPLDKLLLQARLIVHHGGIGTTAAALRTATPQVIIPRRFDQPDNARRIAKLGLGLVVLPERFAQDIGPAVEAALSGAICPSTLETMALRLAGEDGLATAADAISSVLASSAAELVE